MTVLSVNPTASILINQIYLLKFTTLSQLLFDGMAVINMSPQAQFLSVYISFLFMKNILSLKNVNLFSPYPTRDSVFSNITNHSGQTKYYEDR